MSDKLEISAPVVSTEELQSTLEQLLTTYFGRPARILRLDRKRSEYHSSYPIEELQVELDDGSVLDLVFKNLNRNTLLENARWAKPEFLYNPRREIELYRNVLSTRDWGTAAFYGAVADDETQRYWLFLEEAPGLELYQIGDFAIWQEVARWLARLHSQSAGEAGEIQESSPVLVHDANFYSTWVERAREFLSVSVLADGKQIGRSVERLAAGYEDVVRKLMTLPRSLIHGEFYSSNVLVEESPVRMRVCPVDWEMAAIGPGLIDLAALVSGRWTDQQKTALALTYRSAVAPSGNWPGGEKEFLTALDYCQLALAVQWLGWSRNWSPPPEHAQDWLGEALRLAGKLEL